MEKKTGAPSHRLGSKIKGIQMDFLAFADDDMALIAEEISDTQKQITILEEQAAKIGLQYFL